MIVKFGNAIHNGLFVDIEDTKIIEKDFNIMKDYKSGTRTSNKSNYYAVAIRRKVGIYHTCEECRGQVNDYQNATFNKSASERDTSKYIATHQHAGVNATHTSHKLTQLLSQLEIFLATTINAKYEDVKNKKGIQYIFFKEIKYSLY